MKLQLNLKIKLIYEIRNDNYRKNKNNNLFSIDYMIYNYTITDYHKIK
jgi:hypothetical protein